MFQDIRIRLAEKRLKKSIADLLIVIRDNYTDLGFLELYELKEFIFPITKEVAEIKRCLCSIELAKDYKFCLDWAINSLKN